MARRIGAALIASTILPIAGGATCPSSRSPSSQTGTAACGGCEGPMIAVIGCGNASRGDDAAGPDVLRSLRVRGKCRDARVHLLDAGTDGMAVMFAARGCDSLIIIDACRSGSEPGALFEVPGTELA